MPALPYLREGSVIMIKKDNSWVSPRHLLITVYAGILFLACACVNTGMTNTILPRI